MPLFTSLAPRRRCAPVGVLAGALVASATVVSATPAAPRQAPAFAAAVANPFSLTAIGGFSVPASADFDDDGDLDILVGAESGGFFYFENTAGASATPSYGAVQADPFGLTDIGSGSRPVVVDLNGDGDLDVLAGEGQGAFFYFENTAGAGAAPAFAAPVTNPFGLVNVLGRSLLNAPTVADIEGDGDLDVLAGELDGTFVFYENTAGSGATPAYAAPVVNPFGLTTLDGGEDPPSSGASSPVLVDLDGDGDFDVLANQFNGEFAYFENTAGASATPTFAAAAVNPFGLTDNGQYVAPMVADLDGDGDLDVLAGDQDGGFVFQENTMFNVATEALPDGVTISEVAPNPVVGAAVVRLSVPASERVRVTVYDGLGREVAVAFDGIVRSATTIRLDAGRLVAGVYTVRIEADTFAATRRLTVVR